MNPDNQLLVGIVMMSLGGFVALLAFTILREQQKAAKKKAKAELEADVAEDDQAQEKQPKEEEAGKEQDKDYKEILAASLQKVRKWVLGHSKADEPAEPQEEAVEELEAETEVIEKSPPTSNRINVLTLLRNEEKGNLIVKVGDHEYHSSQDLHDSPDWSRVEYAAVDLTAWLRDVEDQDQGIEAKTGDMLESKPHSMVEQIDHFLQQNLAEIENEQRRIKLYEGPDETVHVLIDNNSYAIEEVPDPKVSKLIKEAVSKWEALQ
jgi:hypothetical protein